MTQETTPGPWKVGPLSNDYYYEGYGIYPADAKDTLSLGLAACIDNLADAQLMARAPDLLAALFEIREEVSSEIDIEENGGPNWAGRIVNIIDRALGEIP